MKTLLQSLGYVVSEERVSNSIQMEFCYIPNPDGTPRWIWPSYLERPLFLKFYNVSGGRSMLFVLLVKIVFRLWLPHFVFRRKTYYIRTTEKCRFDFCMEDQWSLFSGTPGPNCKFVVYILNQNGGRFIKLGVGTNVPQLLQKEKDIVQRLQHSGTETFRVPDVKLVSNQVLVSSDISGTGERSSMITPLHVNTMIELNELTGLRMPLSENTSWQRLKEGFELLKRRDDKRLPKGMIRKLENMLSQVDETEMMEVCMSHGDFTPWNVYVEKQQLSIYDWELANMFHPLGFDLFHFVIQQGILVDRKNWSAIYSDLRKLNSSSVFSKISKFGENDMDKYLQYYLLFNTMYYLNLYASQSSWHQQVYWLFSTWNEALSCFATTYESKRELVLIDTFDYLLDKPYAAVKFQHMYPERLSLFSDVDMCTDKSTAKKLRNYLTGHPLVNKVKVHKKTYMHTLQVFCADGNLLSLDLIFQVKRKGLESLDVKTLLRDSQTNFFGMKSLELLDNARYIAMFYVMNNARVPAKYTHYEELVGRSEAELDRVIYPYYVDELFPKKQLFRYVKALPLNRGLRGLRNRFNYLLDSIGTLFFNPGTIVTFSGVDGAGKSTVINNLKYRIEKQMRKRVVVLRHRPSVLPILSAWTKGRQHAEQDAALRLPRQGTNNNVLSSLLRFGYYYTDFLIGQFLVYFKYVVRGYVVIYDRYYFDFMNDSKRSNIVLPKFILNMGFSLLMKPTYNFFLYAPTEVIRSRKQELPEEAIESLTRSYMTQFETLGKKSRSKYVSINNLHLDETLNKVFTQISGQAA